MRILLLTGFLFLLLTACNNASDEKPQEAKDTTQAEPENAIRFQLVFPELNQYLSAQDSSFDPSGFEESEAGVKGPENDLPADTAELNKYHSYLLFNADSTLALDVVSYNYIPVNRNGKTRMAEQGPDFEVSLVNFRENKKRRLLFFGPQGGTVLDAKWLDPATVLIAGAIDWNNQDSLRPVLWKYHVPSGEWQQFTYPQRIAANWDQYPKKPYELNAVRTSPVF